MKKVLKNSGFLVLLALILASCGGNSASASSKNSSSNKINNSSTSSSSKVEQPSSSSSTSNNEELSGNHVFYDNFVKPNGWNIINADPVYNAGLKLSNNENKEIILTKNHISLLKDKNYKLIINASGNGNLKVELLNHGSIDIIKGMDTTYNLSNEKQEYSFVFATLDNYENVFIKLTINGNILLNNIILDKINLYGDYEAPVFSGVDDRGLYIQSKFDYLSNIKVVDNVDGDISHKFSVELPSDVNVNDRIVTFNKAGEYKFIYSCEDKEENKTVVERVITVYDTMPSGYEFIKNGSFDGGLDLWYHDAYDGAEAEFQVVKEEDNNILKTTITAIPAKGSYQPFPRLVYGKLGTQVETDELVIEKGCSYTLSFKIKGDVARTFQVGVGEVLDQQDANGNWTYYFAQEPSTYGWGLANRNITTEWQTYTIDFTMALDYTNLNGCILFCFGDCGDNPQIGTFYLDDVSLVKK